MTDHIKEAQEALDAAHSVPPEIASLYAATAQVHATLALVEQQRAANLIAYADHRWTDGAQTFMTSKWSAEDAIGQVVAILDLPLSRDAVADRETTEGASA